RSARARRLRATPASAAGGFGNTRSAWLACAGRSPCGGKGIAHVRRDVVRIQPLCGPFDDHDIASRAEADADFASRLEFVGKALRTLHAPARTHDAEAQRRVVPPPARPRLRPPRFVRYPPGGYSALSISSGPDGLRSSVPVGET